MHDSNIHPTNASLASTAADLPAPDRAGVWFGFAIGVTCCLIGPIFLFFYYAFLGIGIGFLETISFLGLAYVAPNFFAVAIGLLLGNVLSPLIPHVGNVRRMTMVICIAGVMFSVGIFLLVNDHLNFGVDLLLFELPAFSVACGLVTLAATGLYMSMC